MPSKLPSKVDGERYIHNEIGYNYRLSSIQAALGCAQMEVLDEYVAAKRGIAGTYRDALGKIPGITDLAEATSADSANWLYTVAIDAKQYGMSSRALMERLRESGIQSRPLCQPMHLSVAHAGAYAHECTVAERLWRDGFSLPSSVGLTKVDQARVIQALTVAPGATVELDRNYEPNIRTICTLGPFSLSSKQRANAWVLSPVKFFAC